MVLILNNKRSTLKVKLVVHPCTLNTFLILTWGGSILFVLKDESLDKLKVYVADK